MRLTPRGRVLAFLSVGFAVAGRILALREFTMAGAALLVVLLVAAVAVKLRRADLKVRRDVRPSRTEATGEVRVELAIRRKGVLGAGPVLCADRIPEALGESVRLTLPRGGSGRRERTIAYVLRPGARGRYRVGPLEIVHTDPFGAVERVTQVPGVASFIVYPPYERVERMPAALQRLGIVRHSPLLGQGEEFYTLREYEEGDDLRKIHWPSSAKRGKLLLRQEELLAEPRVFVLLDTCSTKHRGRGKDSSLEAAVSACASIGVQALGRRMRLEVLTSDGPLVTGRRTSTEDLLEALAVLEASGHSTLAPALAQLDPRRVSGASSVVLITPGLNRSELAGVTSVAGQTRGGAVVHVAADTFAPRGRRPDDGASLAAIGLPILELKAGDSFRRVWEGGLRHAALA